MPAPEPACPHCGSANGLPLLWGYPGPRALQARQQGLVELGGCMVDDAHLNRHCRDCGHRWECENPPAVDLDSVRLPPAPERWARIRRIWSLFRW